ncbi:hypothetical protein HQ305_20005 [Rhodococcus sp. BP-149]|uniref:DUF5677 domain-containing protein n=1 Tax=unclassified Rhodococcus (in: high G+C Gram-positive bacteria) TaxID=192944 RepID=UPI001C9B63C7|nr:MULTISPECIES: DUF5677 domain-containing protein [unclassified Rhodococcus (in: high G+C Gram-positive bacteria)]MBY6687520.1 hypothetical protein [Rhodococcus sp. BP-288]MBY6695685.1 hypothetical protein [Rhodococcus sp. BP-188]MBY6700517.1 hypothetical protein [Rhodococcus sp. BP-285]MBY6704460.1 hypothetical protein [Rhodococcus sp. BP-283]MBY6713642.1 hypothetical protein [Rhodococcus sp. BP-160]
MTADDYEPPASDRLLEIIDQLCAGWQDFLAGSGREFISPRDTNRLLTAPLVMALASHVTELGIAVAALVRGGSSGLTVMPLVRAMYESAITGQWIAQLPDAAMAFINEDARSREALAKDLPHARGRTFRESVDVIRRQIVPKLTTSSEAQARAFKQRCLDLEVGGVDAYIYYRVASSLTHPSVLVADRYLESVDGILRIGARANDIGDAWIFLASASVVWAQMAANYCDPHRTRRSILRAIGRELGIEPELKPSAAAWSRASARKQTRQA